MPLVLARKRNESVVADLPDGTTMVVTVAEIRGDKVRLAFAAGPEIGLRRSEVPRRDVGLFGVPCDPMAVRPEEANLPA